MKQSIGSGPNKLLMRITNLFANLEQSALVSSKRFVNSSRNLLLLSKKCRTDSVGPAAENVSTLYTSSLSTFPPGRRHLSSGPVDKTHDVYDVFIVGGGVTGTALLYVLSAFTDVSKVGLAERRSAPAVVASKASNNSQTIHCGDIESNYTLEKAISVSSKANILRNYCSSLPEEIKARCMRRMQKMLLAVGQNECETLFKRFKTFQSVFENMRFIEKKQIAELEPRVGMLNSYEFRRDDVAAIFIPNEYSAINYQVLSEEFINSAKTFSGQKTVDFRTNTEVTRIVEHSDGTFTLTTNCGVLRTKYVVVSACGHSLQLANRMGFGLNYSCLPVAGSFYFSKEPVLNGKVYTMQNPLLPFAAVHGDPDILADGNTRFGPTALPLPLLERYNYKSFKDFLEVLKPDLHLLQTYFNLFMDTTIRNYVLKNFLFEVPYLNTELFANSVQRIIPSIKGSDLVYAKGYGGVRPQLVDKLKQKLLLGEGRIKPEGHNIVFNITPSPGATMCLGTAYTDAIAICKALNINFKTENFQKLLVKGPHSVNESHL